MQDRGTHTLRETPSSRKSGGIFSYDQEDFDRAAVLSQSIFDPQVLISLLVLGTIFFIAYRCYAKKPLVTFCIGWFFIGLLPGSNIIPSGIYFAERYLYAGSLGLCLLFGYYMNRMIQDKHTVGRIRLSAIGVAVIICITTYCIGRIYVRNLDGRHELALHHSAVRENPQSALLRTDLGQVYLKYQMPEIGLEHFRAAMKIRWDDPVIYFSMADAYLDMGENENAIEALKDALKIDPQYPEAHYNLAGTYASMGRRTEAKKHIDLAVKYFRQQGKDREAREYQRIFKIYFGML